MRLDFQKCKEVGTSRHNTPDGRVVILDGDDKLIAHRRNPNSKGWDWIRKGFQFFIKKKK